MFHRTLLLAFCAAAATWTAGAQDNNTQSERLEEIACRTAPPAKLSDVIDLQTGAILNGQDALGLIALLLNGETSSACDPDAKSYRTRNFGGLLNKDKMADPALIKRADFIIHVARWADPAPQTDKQKAKQPTELQENAQQTIQQQRWYLLHKGEILRPGRLFGGKRVYFIYIHLNYAASTHKYSARYDFKIAEAIPSNEQNLSDLASLLMPSTPVNALMALRTAKAAPAPENIWGGMQIDTWFSTYDLEIDSNVIPIDDSGEPQDPSPLDKPLKIHSERPEWWDVSGGVPIRKMSQLNFEGSSNSLAAQQVDKKSIYGLLNFYPLPWQRRDLVYSNFTWWPSLLAGLPASKQPLHQPLFGVGWGPRFVQFYIGAIIQKQPSLPQGTTLAAGTQACTGWCPQFAFGINLPVKALQAKLKAKPANAGGAGNSQEGAGQSPAKATK